MAIETPIEDVTVECDTPSDPVEPGAVVEVGVELSNYSEYEIGYEIVLSVGGEFAGRFDSVISRKGIAIETTSVQLYEPGEYDVNVEVDVERQGSVF
jgi:hypothetical protein